MATPQEKFQLLSNLIKTKIPSFQNKLKSDSLLLRLIGFFVSIFNKKFFTDYITTIGNTVYWPSKESMDSDWAWSVLAHEYVHLSDSKKHPVLFPLGYLFPQVLSIFALGALGAVWSLWCLLFLVALLFLLPLPAPWRTHFEMRGYTMSMATTEFWYINDVTPEMIDWVTLQFTSMAYYRMCGNEKEVRSQIRQKILELKDKSLLKDEPYQDVHKMLVDLGEIK